jgi:hypothetical protein
LKLKAASDGLKLKDLIAEACHLLLSKPVAHKKSKARRSPFPVLKGGHPAKPGEEITPERIAQILWGSTE